MHEAHLSDRLRTYQHRTRKAGWLPVSDLQSLIDLDEYRRRRARSAHRAAGKHRV
jgi:hypothetical protein